MWGCPGGDPGYPGGRAVWVPTWTLGTQSRTRVAAVWVVPPVLAGHAGSCEDLCDLGYLMLATMWAWLPGHLVLAAHWASSPGHLIRAALWPTTVLRKQENSCGAPGAWAPGRGCRLLPMACSLVLSQLL